LRALQRTSTQAANKIERAMRPDKPRGACHKTHINTSDATSDTCNAGATKEESND
jgi:hypothetical protein